MVLSIFKLSLSLSPKGVLPSRRAERLELSDLLRRERQAHKATDFGLAARLRQGIQERETQWQQEHARPAKVGRREFRGREQLFEKALTKFQAFGFNSSKTPVSGTELATPNWRSARLFEVYSAEKRGDLLKMEFCEMCHFFSFFSPLFLFLKSAFSFSNIGARISRWHGN